MRLHQPARGLHHGRRAAQVGAPAVEPRGQVGADRIGDEAQPLAVAGGAGDHHDVHLQAGMLRLQFAQLRQAVHVGVGTHAEVKVDRLHEPRRDRAAHDRQDGREPRAARRAKHGTAVLGAQVGGAQRAAHAHGVAHAQLFEDVGGDAAARHTAHMEFELRVAAQPGHRVRPCQLGAELQLRVLARRELQRLVGFEAQAADVVREHVDARDRGLEHARRVHHHLVGLGDLDGAAFGQRALAGQHVTLALPVGPDRVLAAVEQLPRHHLAAAGAAAPRHAAVRHRHLVLAQHLEQVRAGADLEGAGKGVNVQVHRRALFFWRRRQGRLVSGHG
ncbi:hypothetical protein D3C72_1301380 [compost metagenome]